MTRPGLTLSEDGIWRAPATEAVHYPEDGSDQCFTIEDRSFWFAHRNRVILDAVARLDGPQGPILDVGAGNGFVARALTMAGHAVTVLEPSEAGAANARRRGLDDVVCAAFRAGLFGSSNFGCAGLFDVIEHVEDDVAFARDVAGVLQPGGHIVVTVPAFQALFSADDVAAGHFRRYDRASVLAMLGAAGYEPVRASYFMAALVPPLFLLRTLPGWLGLRRGIDHARNRREHGDGSTMGSAAGRLLALETGVLARGGSMPFGTSVLAVGRLPSRL